MMEDLGDISNSQLNELWRKLYEDERCCHEQRLDVEDERFRRRFITQVLGIAATWLEDESLDNGE